MIDTILSAIENDEEVDQQIDYPHSYAQLVKTVIPLTHRKILIYSEDFEHDIYDNEETRLLLSQFVRGSYHREVYILLVDTDKSVNHGHAIIELHRRLPSQIHIRQHVTEYDKILDNLFIGDDLGMLIKPSNENRKVYFKYKQRAHSNRYIQMFEHAWEHSAEIREFRLLSL